MKYYDRVRYVGTNYTLEELTRRANKGADIQVRRLGKAEIGRSVTCRDGDGFQETTVEVEVAA